MRPGLFGGAGGDGARKTSREPSASDDAPPSKRSAPSSPGGRRPAFNPGLLASPFYGGPTMYGGAGACNSSSPRPRYSSLFYERRKTDVKATPAKAGGAMSQTSKRIWELLAHYSTPISDAMRAPSARPPSETSDAERSVSAPGSTGAPRRLRELRVPGMAALLKLKRNNRTVGSAQAAIAASLSSSLPYRAGEDHATKAKRDRLEPDPEPAPAFRVPDGEPPAKRFTFRDPFDALDRLPRAVEPSPEPAEKPARLWNGTDKSTDDKKKEERVETDTLASFLKKQRSQWECDSCMTRNDSEKAKCACCEGPKPGARPAEKIAAASIAAPAAPLPKIDSGFASLVQKQKSQWECSGCLTRNEMNKNKCACCEAPKPGAENATSSTANSSGFASFLQKQKSQWECSSCLTRNDTSKNICACCEATKPGSKDSAETVKFNFGSASTGSFKFGLDKSNTEPIFDKDNVKKLKASDPIGFSFGSNIDAPKPLAEIKFGMANGTLPADSDKTKPIVFGISSIIDSDKTKSVVFGASPSTDSDKTKSVVFGASSPSDSDKNKSTLFNVPSADSEKSKPITFGILLPDKKEDLAKTAPMPSFNFGSKFPEKTPSTVESPKVVQEPGITVTPSPILAIETVSQIVKEKETELEKSKEKSAIVTAATEPTKPLPALGAAIAPAATQSMFTFGSSPKSSTAFGSSPQFNFSSNSTPKTSESTFKPSLFNFGAKTGSPIVSETGTLSKDSPKVSFAPQESSTLFSTASTVQNVLTPKDSVDGAATPSFKPSEEPKMVSTPSFSFVTPISSPSTLSTAPSIFKNSTSPTPLFTFGGAPASKPESSNVPIFGSKTVVPSTNIFGSSPIGDKTAIIPNNNSMFKTTPATTAPSFSSISGSVNIFGSKSPDATPQANAGNLFGGVSNAENKPAPVFGAALNSSGPQASMFSSPAPSFNAGNVFGSPQPNSVNAQQPSLFNSKTGTEPAAGIFGSKLPTTQSSPAFFGSNPSAGASGIFGSHPAVPTPVFGASIPFGESQSTVQNVPFKFGATSSAPSPGVGFRQAPAAGSSAPVFSFGSSTGAPPPSMNSQFNFSMGAPTPAFPSVPGANAGMPVRRFKKAVRRNVPR